jgi:peptidoglycan/xylan/chitin deacetylase (PgdA/CDA1 family)
MSTASTVLASAALAQLAPAITSLAPLRRRTMPLLAGTSPLPHVAWTYDDGPDPRSTPLFLELLDRHGVSATFFLLGKHVEGNVGLVREMSAAGHELAVHGWDHGCLALKRPGVVTGELRRTREAIEDVTGSPVTWYRPPYGVLTAEGVLAARRTCLRSVLWSTWGRDWSASSTPASIARKVTRVLRPGGTVLLHDTDRTAAPGSWRNTLAASDLLLQDLARQGVAVGPLRDHWPVDTPATRTGGPG